MQFTDRELDVMRVLWQRGGCSVTEVRRELDDELAYTTVLTVLRTLEEKGHVGHLEEGRSYRYHALVARESAERSAVRKLLRGLFDGSAELLLTQIVSDRGLSDQEMRRVRKLLDERLSDAEDER